MAGDQHSNDHNLGDDSAAASTIHLPPQQQQQQQDEEPKTPTTPMAFKGDFTDAGSSSPSTATMATAAGETRVSVVLENGDPEKGAAGGGAAVRNKAGEGKLPDGCAFGELAKADGSVERVIWVDFAPGSRENPFYFSRSRKIGITAVATFFTFLTAYTTAAFSISAKPMCVELGCDLIIVEGGVALYAFGFGIFPLALAPISEEFGRKWTYIVAVFLFLIFQIPIAVAKNGATVLVDRFLLGAAGSVGATLVGGTISDIYIPSKRGVPMALFGFCAIFGTGAGATTMAWVVERVGWRWVHWAQLICLGIFFPICVFVMRETRATVLLRRKAAQLRKERGMTDGARYTAKSELDKDNFLTAMLHSISRPIVFLLTEPIVSFFSLWIALGWGVFYTQIAGIPYSFTHLHGFGIVALGQVYWTICIGGLLGFLANFVQEAVYRRQAPKHGVEARLYAPMVAGILFALGCFITGFTSLPNVHWIGPCVGITMVLTAVMIIYITAFTYLSECYGAYASSAIAGQSFLRNMFGGSFSFFTEQMFAGMTVRWALVMCGGVASVLALVPFVAFFWGPQLRARSKYSRLLMQQEHEAIEKERLERQARGMDTSEVEDLEGDANEETMERAISRTNEEKMERAMSRADQQSLRSVHSSVHAAVLV